MNAYQTRVRAADRLEPIAAGCGHHVLDPDLHRCGPKPGPCRLVPLVGSLYDWDLPVPPDHPEGRDQIVSPWGDGPEWRQRAARALASQLTAVELRALRRARAEKAGLPWGHLDPFAALGVT